MAVNNQTCSRVGEEETKKPAALFTPALQLVYNTCKMYSIHKLYYLYLSHHITGSSYMRINGRRRNATQRSRQSFCQDYRANPSPRLSWITTLPLPASEQSQFNRKVDLLCNMKIQCHKSFQAQSSVRWNTRSTNKHSRASHMHRENVKETSHPSREWIRVLWRTKLFNV